MHWTQSGFHLFLVCSFILSLTLRWILWSWNEWFKKRRLESKQEAFELYSHHGQWSSALDDVTDDGAEALGKALAARVALRLHGRTRFQATTDCPKCGEIAVHPFTLRNNCIEDRTVIRHCISCDFEWWES